LHVYIEAEEELEQNAYINKFNNGLLYTVGILMNVKKKMNAAYV